MTDKIPWRDPAFSARMLREHLSQEHGRASRRFRDIDLQVAWLHDAVLGSAPSRVLDLGCGPGFYTSRLARLGHSCVGIDFAPAAIAHAEAEARRDGLACEYRLRDLERGGFGVGFDAVLLISGELNTFPPRVAQRLLTEAHRALVSAGALVLEVHPEAVVHARGERSPSWFSAEQSVFCDGPHLCVTECVWDPASRTSIERFIVLPEGARDLERYSSATHAYTDAEFDGLLEAAGYSAVERHRSLGGPDAGQNEEFGVLIGRKR